MKIVLFVAVLNCCLLSAQTTVLYEPTSPTTGPFPANVLVTPDATQKTGVRVDLPDSFASCDISTSPSVCSNTGYLNHLDGFSVNPRVMACFSGPIKPSTLKTGMEIVPVNGGSAVAINQIIFDSPSNCAFAKPNKVLNQQSQYLLLVTNAIQNTNGKAVTADSNFEACLTSSDPYCEALANALQSVPGSAGTVVAASLFTTMSATTWLEQARRFVDNTQLPLVLPAGFPTSFSLSNVQSMTWVPQGSGDDADNSESIPPGVLSGVGRIAFGFFLSPVFLNPSTGTISQTATAKPIGAPTGHALVSFHIFLPAGPAPAGGYPVAIYGHGLGDNQFDAPTYIASTFAQKGIATLAFEITGHGYGPGGVVKVTETNGKVYTVATPGRGVVLSPGSPIGSTDGCIAAGAFGVRDCGRQTAVDLFALVQTIRETGGLGYGLNPSKIYYVGQSFGSTFGTLFHAVDPNSKAAVLNGDGGTSVDIARLAITGRPLGAEYLASVGSTPSLLNVVDGIAPPEEPFGTMFGYGFNDNYAFRNQPPVTKTIPGAMTDQAAFEAADWLGMVGDPLAFAPHLTTSPLAGVPPKPTLFQFGFGDLEVPNPTETNVVLAANGQSTTWFLRYEKATEIDPNLLPITMAGADGLPILPHRILANPTILDEAGETSIALAEQQQAAAYFQSGGAANPNPNQYLTGEFAGVSLFEIPKTLPTQLNYFQLSLLQP